MNKKIIIQELTKNDLTIKKKGKMIIFELNDLLKNQVGQWRYKAIFTDNEFVDLYKSISYLAEEIWEDIEPKAATSLSSDFDEYYDRKFDNNGYLDIGKNQLSIERPSDENCKLYQLNKKKTESFLYDFKRILDKGDNKNE